MISLYTGTPGSGKSLDVAKKIYDYNFIGKNIICNFPINENVLRKKKNGRGKFIYKNNMEITPQYLVDYAKKNCVKGKENQVLLIIDEAQVLFNAREWNVNNRKEWNEFFQLHRHYGYNVILVTQFDRLIDRQIRSLVEYEIMHRKINNYGIAGAIVGLLSGGALFVRIETWYGAKQRIGSSFFRGNRKLYKLYDSYMSFEDDTEEKEEVKQNEKIQEKEVHTKTNNIKNIKDNPSIVGTDIIAPEQDEDFTYFFVGVS